MFLQAASALTLPSIVTSMWHQQEEHMGKEWWYLPWQWGCWSQLPHSYSIIIIPLTLFSDTQMLIFHALSYSADPILSLSARSSDIELKLLFFFFPTIHWNTLNHVPLSRLSHPPKASCLSFVQTKVTNRSLQLDPKHNGLTLNQWEQEVQIFKKASSSIYRTCMDLRPQ